MPHELRFCRACGCRLGEGVEEYTETVRFQNAASTSHARKSRTASAASPPTSGTGVKEWGGMARKMNEQAAKSATGVDKWKLGRAFKRVPRWMIWVFLPLIVLSMISGPSSNRSLRNRGRSSAAATASNSFLGAHYKTANGGAFIQDVLPPGSAADKAELIGGDTILSFDGKPVKSESDLTNLLINTPPGKTVEVVFMRDGETKTTKVTTVSQEENGRLEEAFEEGPKGFLGVDGDEFKLVQVPGTNVYGVQLNEVYKNRPGYIAGLRDGDLVISFNGIPIRTPEELNRRIDRALPDSTVKIVVVRGNERLEIPVKMGEE
jgi:membrane-associated protease RseP (regulator of RpoE activity)